MDLFSNDEHDEDEMPDIKRYVQIPRPTPIDRQQPKGRVKNDDIVEKFRTAPTRSVESFSNSNRSDWQELYQTSLQASRDDDNDNDSDIKSRHMSYYLHQQPKIESLPANDSFYSNFYQHEQNSSINGIGSYKPKWQSPMPNFLDSPVNVNNQQRDLQRRHTTEIVLQTSDHRYRTPSSHEAESIPNFPPLVKQLTQKFNRIAAVSLARADSFNQRPLVGDPARIRRVTSLTGQSFSSNSDIPSMIRSNVATPKVEKTMFRHRTNSNSSLNSQATFTSTRSQRSRTGPPVSYPKYLYPPPSTGVVIRQIIDHGATLVYDSSDDRDQRKETSNSSNFVVNSRRPSSSQRSISSSTRKPSDSDDDFYDT